MVRPRPSRGRLVVMLGPSGVGKSTVVTRLRELVPGLYFSVSMTTRHPRPGETNGRDYLFVTPEEFQRHIDAGEMLEWADIHGGLQRSGTPAGPVDRALSEGRPVLVEVDLAGARAIRAARPGCASVFLSPPNFDDLAARLRARGTETAADTRRRLETARTELAAAKEFDTIIVNDDVERAARALAEILAPARPSTAPNTKARHGRQ